MNAHTQALFAAFAFPNGGFVTEAPLTGNLLAVYNRQYRYCNSRYNDGVISLDVIPISQPRTKRENERNDLATFNPQKFPVLLHLSSNPVIYPGGENGIGESGNLQI